MVGKLRVFHVIGKLYVCLRDAFFRYSSGALMWVNAQGTSPFRGTFLRTLAFLIVS
jgi:hypothetical protein